MRALLAAAAALASALAFAFACGSSKPPTDRPPLDVIDAPVVATADAAPAPPPTPDAPAGPTTFTLPAPALTVTRAGKGKGKAAELRYKLTAGATQIVEVAVEATVEVEIIGSPKQPPKQSIPKLSSTATVEVVKVEAGTAQVRLTLDAAGPADNEAGAQLAELKGTSVEVALDARGLGREVAVTSRAADKETAQTITSLEHTRLHTIPLPAEPVGVGGTWKVAGKDNVNGIDADVTTTYKLVAKKGDVLTITGELVATAPAQKLARPEGTIDVKSMTGKGTFKVTVDLTRAAPVTSFTQSYEAKMDVDGQSLRVATKLVTSQTARAK